MTRKTFSLFFLLASVLLALAITHTVFVYQGMHLCDLHMRHAEVTLSHMRVNPYHVWSGEVTVPGFTPLPRPGKPLSRPVDKMEREYVHVYPPWHTVFCWFYGWVSWPVCRGIMFSAAILALLFSLVQTWRVFPHAESEKGKAFVFLVMVFGMMGPGVSTCFGVMNYSVLLLSLSLLFYYALDRDHDILAGVLWALMMIKPQVALLFFWPLLFSRKWKTIAVAVALCVGATVLMGVYYGESPVVLLRQLQEAGSAYTVGGPGGILPSTPVALASRFFGTAGMMGWMGSMILLCGVCCWFFRRFSRWWMKMVPVGMFIPVWAYSQLQDAVMGWPFFALIASLALGGGEIPLPARERRILQLSSGVMIGGGLFITANMILGATHGEFIYSLPVRILRGCIRNLVFAAEWTALFLLLRAIFLNEKNDRAR